MFPTWRKKIRAAHLAWEQGRSDAAAEMLTRDSVREFLPAQRLSHEVASELMRRAEQKIALGESSAGWHDFQLAERLGASPDELLKFRQAQTEAALDATRRLLRSGDTALAEYKIAKLEQRQLGGDQRRQWKQIVQLISRARQLAAEGQFAPARDRLERAHKLLPDNEAELAGEISTRCELLTRDAEQFDRLTRELHDALGSQSWQAVHALVAKLLELAPDYQLAHQARQQAWQAVGVKHPVRVARDRRRPTAWVRGAQRALSTLPWPGNAESDTMTTNPPSSQRMVAWIDEVGGFLICLGSELVIGQPTPDSSVDIPVRADLSRRHALVRREGEHYLLLPLHEAKVDGQPVSRPMLLRDGAAIELGESLRLRFTRPHSLSATAVLRVESKHKAEPAVDAIILMSESCVVGPRSHSHICCPGWKHDLVLFRRGEQLQFRSEEIIELDDHPGSTSGKITTNCRLAGPEFALSFEEL